MARFETSNVLHCNKLQTKLFPCFSSCVRKIKSFIESKFTQEIFENFSKRCISLVSICCAVQITEQLTVFVKLSILSNRQRVYKFIFRGYFWKISHVSSLVFLSWKFSKLYFLQIWFIISGSGGMSNFMGVGIFWIGLNRDDLNKTYIFG